MNPNASYPRLYQSQEHNRLFSDYWKEDASYLRLKNIQIGYRFPARMVAPLGINSLRVYASADNLFTKTDYFGAYDPEVRHHQRRCLSASKNLCFWIINNILTY